MRFSPFLGGCNVREKPPLTFHIQAILISTQTMVDRWLSSAPESPFTASVSTDLSHVSTAGGHADAVRLYAGVGSINIGVYRYSSPLSGVFFSSHGTAGTWTDAALLLVGAGAEPRPQPASRDRR